MSPSTSTTTATSVVIVSKSGTLSECSVHTKNETTIDDLTVLLSKKCGFRNPQGFTCYHTWKYKNKRKFEFTTYANANDVVEGDIGTQTVPKYIFIDLWAKTDGHAGQENKYELPPPIDDLLIFGSIALVARIDKKTAVNLTIDLWNVIYEKLFGGFEDLTTSIVEDENEIDELDSIPQHKKTNNGYLKDGFVVDDESEDTPRCKKRITRSRGGAGKKSKSESTESEFVTETETESGTPTSESPNGTDHDDVESDVGIGIPEPIPVNKIVNKKPAIKPKRVIKKTGGVKSKKIIDEPSIEHEIESELSEDSYD
jgi:hypothetical protein